MFEKIKQFFVNLFGSADVTIPKVEYEETRSPDVSEPVKKKTAKKTSKKAAKKKSTSK